MKKLRDIEIFIGEGITEKYYMESMRDVLKTKPSHMKLKPYNLDELDRAIRKYANEGYTKIHCLIDMDNKVNNPKYRELKNKFHNKTITNKQYGTNCKVYFYESFPSIEVFFYYYFEYSTALKSNDGLKTWLKHKCGYDVSDKFLGKHSLHGLFKKNGGCLKRAIENSKKSIASRDDSNYNFIYTEMGKLIEELGIKE